MNQEAASVRPRGLSIRRAALVTLCSVGLVLCGLLLQAGGGETSGILEKICTPSAHVNCASVLASTWSKLGGISAALLGFVYFGALLVWFAGVGIPNRTGRRWHFVPLLLSTLGLCFSAYFVSIMATQMRMWCTLCVGVHVVNALIWLICVVSRPKGAGDVAYPSTTRAGIVLGATGAAVVVLVLGVWSLQLQIAARRFQSEFLQVVNDPAYIEWKLMQQAVQTIPIYPQDLTEGEASAKNTIVVFSDFQCPNCRMFDQFARRMLNLGMDVRIVYKHYPMDHPCNQYVKESLHGYACSLALYSEFASIAAAGDGKQSLLFHHRLYENGEKMAVGTSDIERLAGEIGIRADLFKGANWEIADRKIKDDIELGHRLGVEGTPAIFLNGRRLKTSWHIVTNDIHPSLDLKATDALWRRLLSPASPQK